MSWNKEKEEKKLEKERVRRIRELENKKDYYGRVLKDAEGRLSRGETQYPDGSNIGFFASVYRWLFGVTSDDLDNWRKTK